jgi:hypothetical protein
MKKVKLIIASLAVMMILLVTTSYGQTPSKPASPLTNSQIRITLARTQDALIFANTKLSACQDAVDAYKANQIEDENVKAKLIAERDTYKNLVELLTIQTTEYKSALADQKLATAEADRRADIAIKEVDRQKGKVSFWKKVAKYGTIIGAGAGAATILILQR